MKPTPIILEVALSSSPQLNPNAPTTLAELTKEGLASIDAGASIVHMHLPDLNVPAPEAARQYLGCFEPWRAHSPDILPLPTNGFGDSMEDRFAHQFLLNDAGALQLAFVDPGAIIFGSLGPDGAPMPNGFVYYFNFDAMSYAIAEAGKRQMAMHFACFEPGWVRNVMAYWRAGQLPDGSFVKFYFGGDYGIRGLDPGVAFGLPPTVTALAAYREILEIEGCPLPWFSAVVGGDLLATPVAAATVEQGGHLRVGLEDHAGERHPTNLQLLNEAVDLCGRLGRPVATPTQTREILGLQRRKQ